MDEDLTQWTMAALRESLYEVDDERKALRRRIRKDGAGPDDAAAMEAMDAWAQRVFDEIMRRN